MCDFPGCDAILPFELCRACGGYFCGEHIDAADHGCSPRQPTVSRVAVHGEPRTQQPLPPLVPMELGGGSLMTLGFMPVPMITTPQILPSEVQSVQKVARTLPRETISPQLVTTCGGEKMQRDEPPMVDVVLRLRYCRSSLPGSLGSLIAEAKGPPREGPESQRRELFEWLVGTEYFETLKVVITWTGGPGLELVAHAFDTDTICFRCGAHQLARVADLEAARNDGRKDSIAISLSFEVKTLGLFHPLVAMMFCDDREEEIVNPSQPISPCATGVLASFTLDAGGEEDDEAADIPDELIPVTLKPDLEAMEDLACTLVALDGDRNTCRLSIDFDLEQMHIQDRLHLLHVLIASELSRLAHAKGRKTLERCQRNCEQFFHHCFPITRGTRFLDELIERGLGQARTSACDFVVAVQELIRPWITTANNWNEPCENRGKQPYQWKLARALGKITKAHQLASPMLFLRMLKEHEFIENHPKCRMLKAQIILQAGIGHCREFSEVSFCVLTALADRDRKVADLLGGIYRCEYKSQDHAFVAGGLDMREFEERTGEFIGRWNVAVDLCTTRRRGWVCDPYLESLAARFTLWGKHVGYLQDLEEEEEPQNVGEDDDEQEAPVLDFDALVRANAERSGDKESLRLMREATPEPLLIRERYDHVCLYVVVSVDWEGTNLHPVNLEVFDRHRHDFPQVPLTHFICPQYLCDAFVQPEKPSEFLGERQNWSLTETEPDLVAIKSLVRRGVGKLDEVGLHIHGWTKLIETAKVESKYVRPEQPVGSRWGDFGHDDFLLEYDEEELGKIVANALEYFDAFGFPKPTCFRAGGWAARPELLRAVVAAGIAIDSSMLAASYVNAVSASEPALRKALAQLWGRVPDLPPAQVIELGTDICIYEIPDCCALADYVETDRMVDTAKTAIARVKKGVSQILNLGWHQENGAHSYFNLFLEETGNGPPVTRMWQELQPPTGFYDRVRAVLELLVATQDVRVQFVTVSEAAKLCLDWSKRQ